ncbi:hypothetical protein KDA_41350 [Dictyobacter alpinus]|uniref:DUF11 domain-containing protein n=1 Tax=Dictyobacter alpinus TaxID=2014873 RepID=A0A402BB46_9CHLR|nr:hypothetical protein [Dictyobacter alpinus]GCE28651.1 hypothetical protein KDA_41350 [Dictyobacter alpinus]
MKNFFSTHMVNTHTSKGFAHVLWALLFSIMLTYVLVGSTSAQPGISTRGHILPADLTIHWVVPQTFQAVHVDDSLDFSVVVSNHGDQLTGPMPITIVLKLASGLNDLHFVNTKFWHASFISNRMPTSIRAYYVGPLPLRAGQSLERFTFSARLNQSAVPDLTLQALVTSPGDTNPRNNTASYTLGVLPHRNNHPHF